MKNHERGAFVGIKTQEVIWKSQLSPSQKRLLDMMQELCFGTIKNLTIKTGQPVIDPPPRIIHEIKFGGDNGPHSMHAIDDFVLKDHVRKFFLQLEAMGDGTIRSLEVKHGLPFRMTYEEDYA